LSEPPKKLLPDGTDLEKLAKAVALHETNDCRAKSGAALVNNCFGIMQWDKNGVRSFKRYATKEESYQDFYRIWEKHYRTFPTKRMAEIYSGNDRSDSWLSNVSHFYSTL